MSNTIGQGSGGLTDVDKERLVDKLDRYAVPMITGDFSRETYQRFFPRGTVQTPIGEVKLGENQFTKLQEKDQGKRAALIGAMFQTLSDPVAVIKEREGDREADVFIKSFYKRKHREVVNKIKKADGIVFEKTDSGSRTNGEEPNSTHHE